MDLDLPGAVAEVEERGLAVPAAGGHPAGDAVGGVGLLAGGEALVRSPDLGDLGAVGVLVRERLDPRLAQALELRPPFGENLRLGLLGLTHGASLTPGSYAASILVIFSFFFGPRGTATSTTSPFLWPTRAWPIGDSLESFCSAGSASAEPTIWNFCDSPDFWSLTWTDGADADGLGVDVLLVDHRGAAELLLQVEDPLLEHRLLVLGVVVLGVLGDVAELAGLLDPLGDLAPPVGRENLDLFLQLLQTVFCDQRLASHVW